jgi:5'-3' exonuclease
MTDNEIIKGLLCCANNGDCKECPINPHHGNYGYCTSLAIKHALDLINRQKAEIEQLKRNLEQCENGYRQQIHVMQCEYEQLQQKYNLAVAEREANVKGFAEQLAKLKTEVAREIFADIEKIITKHHDGAQDNEEDEELDAAISYLSYVSCDVYDLEEKYGVYDETKS